MKLQVAEISRYIVNGLFATAVHFVVLSVSISLLGFKSAGLANLFAVIFGIITSFLGSRYFVFKQTEESLFNQAVKFGSLYGAIAILHGLSLWLWTDVQGLDYRVGFFIATGMQVLLSYIANKRLVFNP